MLKAHLDAVEQHLLHISQIPANAGHALHRGTPREAFISRRNVLGTLALSCAVPVAGSAATATPAVLELTGIVGWCHRVKGLLNFRPDRHDAAAHLVALERPDDDGA